MHHARVVCDRTDPPRAAIDPAPVLKPPVRRSHPHHIPATGPVAARATQMENSRRDPRGRGSALLRVIEAGDIENSLDRPDGGPALGGKKRMLMKQGKTAMSAKHKAMMAGAATKRLRN